MEMIEVRTVIHSDLHVVWDCFTNPLHITGWNFASEDWHCPKAESMLEEGGKFCYTMAAKDGSMSFDYWGHFRKIEAQGFLEFSLGEDLGESRWVSVEFKKMPNGEGVEVIERFVPEDQNPLDMQRMGWQMILDNFKKYCESL